MKLFTLLLCIAVSAFSFAQNNKPAQLIWKFNSGAPVIGSPVSDDSSVYLGSTNGTLYALDVNNGVVKWTFPTGGPIRSTICLNKDKLFLLSGDGNLYCINKFSGKLIWLFHTLTGYLGDTQKDFADYYQSSPVLYNNYIYFGSGDGYIYALHETDGSLAWKFETGGNVHTIPCLYKDKLFAGSFDGNLYALNNKTGALLWKFKSVGHRYFPKGEMMGNPVITKGIVLAGSRDYNLYAIDINGGYCLWMKQFEKGWALPVTINDSITLVGTSEDRVLLALDSKTGNEQWKTNLGFNIFGACAISKTTGYVGTLIGKMFAVDLVTGKIQWTFNTDGYNDNRLRYFKAGDNYRDDISDIIGSLENIVSLYNNVGAIFSTPAIIGNRIIFSSADGKVYCISR